MNGDDGTVPAGAPDLLPVSAARLSAVPGSAETARTVGADRGIDYLADVEVAAMLHRHRRLLSGMTSCGIWGGLLLGPAAAGAWFLIGYTDWETSDPMVDVVLCAPVAVLLTLSVYLLVRSFRHRRAWLRDGTRDQVNGYLQVLSAAGLSDHRLPAWLKPVTGERWR